MSSVADDTSAGMCGIDVVAAFVSCALLTVLIVPAVAQSRANDDRVNCMNHAARIMLGMFDYMDSHKTFPLASTQPLTAKPGHVGRNDDSAGYSWLVKTLPYVDETKFYDLLNESSHGFSKPLYDPTVTADDVLGIPSRNYVVDSYLCPTYAAQHHNDGEARLAISNYHVFPGTHFYNTKGIGRIKPAEQFHDLPDGRAVPNGYEGNGVIPFPGYIGDGLATRGLSFLPISDGTSKTLVYAETIEQDFAAWMDGQTTWLVAAWPGNPDTPADISRDAKSGYSQFWGWSESQLPNNWTSIGKSSLHDADGTSGLVYLPADRWSGAKDRIWGPSSYHDGVVTHVFADGHGKLLSVDIDKNVYLYLVTRNGRESVPEEITAWEKGSVFIIRD